jgi:F-type H+-transporting ATPase subunit delta
MKDRKLATRYARALLASLPAEQAEQADRFLTALREATDQSAEFRDLMLDPAVPRTTRNSVLRALAEQHDMPRLVLNFLATVVDHNRTSSLPSIAEVFREERERAAGILPAEITTAVPLTDDLRERTRLALEQATGQKIRLTAKTDNGLIGGAVTRVGSTVYDGSLRTQLNRLREKMTQE